jgi:hypothetical protein
MISKRFEVGRELVLPTHLMIAPAFVANGAFTAQAAIPMNFAPSTGGGFLGLGTKTSVVGAGAVPTADRNVQWLHYMPGNIAHVPFNGSDALTGKMSGCPLVIFRLGGIFQAGHIGTIVGNGPANALVLGTWNAWATANAVDVIAGYNPAGAWAAPPGGNLGHGFGVMGMLTAGHHHLYSIFMWATGVANTWRVAGLRRVPTLTLHQLQNL